CGATGSGAFLQPASSVVTDTNSRATTDRFTPTSPIGISLLKIQRFRNRARRLGQRLQICILQHQPLAALVTKIDLHPRRGAAPLKVEHHALTENLVVDALTEADAAAFFIVGHAGAHALCQRPADTEIGRASCRGRVWLAAVRGW